MNRIIATLSAGALVTAFAIAPASAQVLTSPGYTYQQGTFGMYYGPRAYNAPRYNGFVAQPYSTYGYIYNGTRYEPGYGPLGLGTGGVDAIGAD